MWDLGLEVFVHDDLSARVGLQTDGCEIELVAVRLASDGIQERLAANDLAAFKLGEDAVALGVEADFDNFFAKAEDSSILAELETEAFDDLAIDKVEKHRALIEESDFYAERREH